MKLHAYTKGHLARLYFPDSAEHVATNRLARWINRNPSLLEALRQCGYRPRNRCFTVRQVQIIIHHLGEPD